MFLVSLTRMPVNGYAINIITEAGMNQYTVLLVYLVASVTAGLFEETARYIGLKYLINKEDYEEGITYGAGHGGIESILLVGINVFTVGVILLRNPELLPAAQLNTITSMAWYLPLVGAYERVMTIIVHISLSVMVLESIREKTPKWFILAVIAHIAVDYISTSTATRSILYAELVVTVFAVGLAQWAYSKVLIEIRDDTVAPTP
jgi:uncharacterized membrane protein YhfC